MANTINSIIRISAGPAAALLLNMASVTALAQEQAAPPSKPRGYWGMGFSLSSLSFESASAEAEGVKDRAFGIGMVGNYWMEKTLLTLGMDFYSYSDNASFRQRTVSTFGDSSNSKSSASAMGLFAAFGPYMNIGPENNNVIYTQIGFNQVVGSDRSISNCSDCYSEDIDLEAGLFLKAGFFHNFGNHQLGLEAHQYLTSDDFSNTISLTWGLGY